MNTVDHKPANTFITCKRCGYIVNTDEELCSACQKISGTTPLFYAD